MTDTTTSSSSNEKGIDIQQALEILSQRGTNTGLSSSRTGGVGLKCNCCEKPANFASLGQTIHLIDDDNDTEHPNEAVLRDMEALKQKVNEERQQRQKELETKLDTLSKEELLKCFFEAQEQRVQTYRLYDQ